jgi:hypothetical protein
MARLLLAAAVVGLRLTLTVTAQSISSPAASETDAAASLENQERNSDAFSAPTKID